MAKSTAIKGLLAGCLAWLGAAPAWAAPTVAEILSSYKPRFEDVAISTPAPQEHAGCEVKLVTGGPKGSSGWLLLDSKKKPVRRFFDSNGDKKIDVWSYYRDGDEVYREIDSNFNDRADQFRWLNAGGMKWGVSSKEDGKIDYWRMISAEEVAQEVFQALTTRDYDRLQTLFISQAEMRALELPAAEAQRLVQLQKGAAAKFQATLAKFPGLDGKAQMKSVESSTPQCATAESVGAKQDLIRFPSRDILFETADKKHDWVQSGEMIQVGLAWRLADAPGTREIPIDHPPPDHNPELRKLIDILAAHDNKAPAPLPSPEKNEAVQDYNLKRVDIVNQIMKVDDVKSRENWFKQIFDNLSAAAQAGSDGALKQLGTLREQVETKMPGSNLAGYATFREMWATYAPKLAKAGPDYMKVQQEWHDRLTKFVQAYPKAEDTPDALMQLAGGCEILGQDAQAKGWYQQVYTNFPDHFMAERARGSERRLGLIGQKMELAGPQLGNGATFDIGTLKGKVVVVYYWAHYVNICERDFTILKRLQQTHAKDLQLVCVNLDNTADLATQYLHKTQVQGTHLFQQAKDGGGLNSPLATYYGISGLPNLFLVGRDGLVISRTLQATDLENELKKAL